MSFSIYTIICVLGLTVNPFCTINGKLPFNFDNFQTCDKAIDHIIMELDEQLKNRQISLVMICKKNDKINT
tara:strand:- start:4960 stop:5172 length:213 start_codon:yes stop_codon:yes gene_type:complete